MYHVSSLKGWEKLFWILVVVLGFLGSTILINESFQNWKKNPIKTTIETFPITNMTLPKITVCPPKENILNLNYDINQAEEKLINDTSRNDILFFAMEVLQDEFVLEIMNNISKVGEQNQYHNWHYGHTELKYPFLDLGKNSSRKKPHASNFCYLKLDTSCYSI